jgi:anaerobic selenocysteine-containing dehydrogenase
MKRREFIILTGAGATGATLLSACAHPEEKLIPVLIPDNEFVPGVDYWKASTCGMCSAGCGIVVRTREHKANKIEGNPLHPVNRGGLCARGQAGLQVLYNPDRIKGPLKRVGERGEGKWQDISWDEAIKILAGRLREIRSEKSYGKVVLATRNPSGVTAFAGRAFAKAYGAGAYLAADSPLEDIDLAAYEEVYGQRALPVFDIANATYLISFNARFLETWNSPVMYSRAYAEFRQTTGRARGRFVQVEPRMSLTGANADQWLAAKFGTEGLVALAIAQTIIREGLIKEAAPPTFLEGPLEDYSPEKTAERTGISPERVIQIAREFAAAQRPLALGDPEIVKEARNTHLIAINYLNRLAGNIDKPGGVLLPAGVFSPFDDPGGAETPVWHGPIDWGAQGEKISAYLLCGSNPIYSFRSLEGLFRQIPLTVSFSPFMDETTELADLVLPDHSDLESWDLKPALPGGRRVTLSIQRPIVSAQLDTRQTADVLFELALELSEGKTQRMTAETAVAEALKRSLKSSSHSADERDAEIKSVLDAGVWTGEIEFKAVKPPATPAAFSLIPRREEDALHEADASIYALVLLQYEHQLLGFGEHANLPLLQEVPDPLSTVMWGSWLEVNPATAAELGISDGDEVTVETGIVFAENRGVKTPNDEVAGTYAKFTVPAVLSPAIRPEVVAMPYGQGHDRYGRYANGTGANTYALRHPILDPRLKHRVIPVKVTKTGRKGELIRFGSGMLEQSEPKR